MNIFGGSNSQVTGAIIGDSDTALNLPGTSDENGTASWACNAPGNVLTTAMHSMEIWVKSSQSDATILGTTTAPKGLTVGLQAGHVEATFYLTNSTTMVVQSAQTITNGAWHQVVLSSVQGYELLYVDGQLSGLSNSGEAMGYGGGFTVCNDSTWSVAALFSGATTFYNGAIDEISTYDKPLTLAQVQNHYILSGRTLPLPQVGVKDLLGGSNAAGRHVCECMRAYGLPVDTQTGNFYHSFSDLPIAGRGPAIAFSRTYNSTPGLTLTDGPFGYGWSGSYDARITTAAGVSPLVIRQENGAEVSFLTDGAGGWNREKSYTTSSLTDLSSSFGTIILKRNGLESLVFSAASRKLVGFSDRNGETTTFGYDASSNLTSVTDSAGKIVVVSWTGTHVTGLRDMTGRTVAYSYDGNNDLREVVDVRGGHWQFTYYADHRMQTMRSPKFFGDTTTVPSPVITNVYDAQGRVTSQTDELGHPTTWNYTTLVGSGGVIVTDVNGNKIADFYNATKQLTSQTRGYGTAYAATWTYSYDPLTLGVVGVTDPLGHTTSTTYDTDGNPIVTTDALGHSTAAAYNAFREPLTVTDANGVKTTNTYDANGNLLTSATPCKLADGTTSCTAGATVTTTFAHGNATHPGDVTSVTDANGHISTPTYNADGTVQFSDSPTLAAAPFSGAKIRTSFNYDGLGRGISSVSGEGNKSGGTPAAHRSAVLLDRGGLPLMTFDRVSQPTLDTFTRVNSASLGSAETTGSWTVTPAGAVFSVVDGAAKLTTVSGTKNLVTVPAYADGTFGFSLAQTLTGANDNFGLAFRVTDSSNFWSLRAIPSSTKWQLVKVVAGVVTNVGTIATGTCCAAGDRMSVVTAGSSIKVFKGTTQLVAVTDTALQTATKAGLFGQTANVGAAEDFFVAKTTGAIASTVYDANGAPTSIVDAEGRTSTTVYDSAGRVTQVNRAGGTVEKFDYDNLGNRTKFTDGNNNAHTWSYSDAAFVNAPTVSDPPGDRSGTCQGF